MQQNKFENNDEEKDFVKDEYSKHKEINKAKQVNGIINVDTPVDKKIMKAMGGFLKEKLNPSMKRPETQQSVQLQTQQEQDQYSRVYKVLG